MQANLHMRHRDVKMTDKTAGEMECKSPGSGGSHRCGFSCLGPLSFHSTALGTQVSLSHQNCLAERAKDTFKEGLVFSSRPLLVRERIRLRVQGNCEGWHGALRVGFTNIPPMERDLPLPSLTIPDLTNIRGHWVVTVPETYCSTGAELEFWVSGGGNLYIRWNDSIKCKLLQGVDLSQPLWAIIDIYGQTSSILLLGSEINRMLQSRKSCPTSIPLPSIANHNYLHNARDMQSGSIHLYEGMDNSIPCQELTSDPEAASNCVVCLVEKPSITLLCGHKCVCLHCGTRVIEEFGTCPVCRQQI